MTKTYNEEKVRETLRLIAFEWKARPSAFNMDTYGEKSSCGSSMCFAGWGLHSVGAVKWRKFTPEELRLSEPGDPTHTLTLTIKGKKLVEKNLKKRTKEYRYNPFDLDEMFGEAAQELFGFTPDEGDRIFHAFDCVTPEEIARRVAVSLGEAEDYFLSEVQ